MPIPRMRADFSLVAVTVIWGATFVVVKDALADASALAFIAVRFALAAFLMAIFFRRSLRALDLRTIWAGAQIGFFLFAGYVFQTVGLKFTTPSKSAFINSSSVILVPILLAVFARRHIRRWVWAGALAALLGLYFLSIPPEGPSALNRGDPITLLGALMFALHIIFVARYIEHHSVGGLSVVQVATTAALATLSLPLLGAAGWEAPRLAWTGNLVFGILVTAIGSTAIGFSVQVWAQKYTAPTHTAIIISLEPVFAVITSWLLAREHLGGRMLLGAALVFTGILLAELKGPTPVAPESAEPVVPSTP